MSEREVVGIAKACAYAILWLAAAVILLREIVGRLWGSASNIGMIAAVAALAGGVLGLTLLALLLYRDVRRSFRPKPPSLEDRTK